MSILFASDRQSGRTWKSALPHALLALLFWALVPACQKPVSTAAPPSAGPAEAPAGQPQPKLPSIKLWIGTNEFQAELATTQEQWNKGMMFRTEMQENEGMLFLMPRPHRASFWMRNTLLPLSCAYLDSEGTILELHDMRPLDETPIEAATDQVQYVLETRQGWFQRHRVKPGMAISSERGPLKELVPGNRSHP